MLGWLCVLFEINVIPRQTRLYHFTQHTLLRKYFLRSHRFKNVLPLSLLMQSTRIFRRISAGFMQCQYYYKCIKCEKIVLNKESYGVLFFFFGFNPIASKTSIILLKRNANNFKTTILRAYSLQYSLNFPLTTRLPLYLYTF